MVLAVCVNEPSDDGELVVDNEALDVDEVVGLVEAVPLSLDV